MMNELRKLAQEMHATRPDWDIAGIETMLGRVHDRGTLDEIRDAAARVLADPDARTPYALTFNRYWTQLGPMPECAWCRSPRRRGPAPSHCPTCRRRWREHRAETYR